MKKNMKPKILFLDFDETLLCSDKTVSEENQRILRQVVEQGNYIAFTTGRPIRGAKRLFEATHLPREHCYLLCYQGCFFYDLKADACLEVHPMDKADLKHLVKKMLAMGIYFQAFYEGGFCCLEETETTKRYYQMTGEPYVVLEDMEALDAYDIYKVMAIDYENRRPLEDLRDAVTDKSQYPFASFFSSPWFYEFCGAGQNKGAGLRWLAGHLGVAIEDTIAMGDEENDLSMIEAAGLGVAMCNAREEIKAQADLVTTRDNNHSGVAEIAQKYILDASDGSL